MRLITYQLVLSVHQHGYWRETCEGDVSLRPADLEQAERIYSNWFELAFDFNHYCTIQFENGEQPT